MAFLEAKSEENLRSFFVDVCSVKPRLVATKMHCTVYHARRAIPGIADIEEQLLIAIPGQELRMMAMAPGGENPRPDIDPASCPVGLRVRRSAADPLNALRMRFVVLETPEVLGGRLPSNRRRNAFGARHYQPHITVLRAGAVRDPDLSELGSLLRSSIGEIRFDRLIVKYRSS